MPEQYILWNDIIDTHAHRMEHLRKYYPFFKLQEMTFAQYKDGQYAHLDMGYITLASLRFFIDENNFNERRVTFTLYRDFLRRLLVRDFSLEESDAQMEELIRYIFDKIKNDGKPFYFHYFDPKDHKQKTMRVKLIESEIENGSIFYRITADGVALYLETKEVKEESQISIQQLLLEKMIESSNFKGGIDVVKRINAEVSKMLLKKQEVIRTLEIDVFEGVTRYQNYMDSVAKWFTEEEKLFKKNKELIDTALSKAELSAKSKGEASQKYYVVLKEIYELETELKKTIRRHASLVSETMELTKVTDSIVSKAKLHRLRPVFDFRKQLKTLEERDDVSALSHMILPLLKPQGKKTFSFQNLDRLLTNRPEHETVREKVEEAGEEEAYVYPDEVEQERINMNFKKFAVELLEQIKKKHTITLSEWNAILEIRFGKEIYANIDYYSFLVHLCQKKEYAVSDMINHQDTFLDGIVAKELSREEKERYEAMTFRVEQKSDEELMVYPGCFVSDMVFERTDL